MNANCMARCPLAGTNHFVMMRFTGVDLMKHFVPAILGWVAAATPLFSAQFKFASQTITVPKLLSIKLRKRQELYRELNVPNTLSSSITPDGC